MDSVEAQSVTARVHVSTMMFGNRKSRHAHKLKGAIPSIVDSRNLTIAMKENLFPGIEDSGLISILVCAMRILNVQDADYKTLWLDYDPKELYKAWKDLNGNVRLFGMELYVTEFSASLEKEGKRLAIHTVRL